MNTLQPMGPAAPYVMPARRFVVPASRFVIPAPRFVIPAKAGIQAGSRSGAVVSSSAGLDPRVRGDDGAPSVFPAKAGIPGVRFRGLLNASDPRLRGHEGRTTSGAGGSALRVEAAS